MITMEIKGDLTVEQYRTRIISAKLNISTILTMFDRLQVKHWSKIGPKIDAIKKYNRKWLYSNTCNKKELQELLEALEGCLSDLIELRAYYKRLCRRCYDDKWIIYLKDNIVMVGEPMDDTNDGINRFVNNICLNDGVYELFTINNIYRIHINNIGKLSNYAPLL